MSHAAPPNAEHDRISEAAAQWCMRLQEADCTDAERAEFQAWLAQAPLHQVEFDAMREIWQVAGDLPMPSARRASPRRRQLAAALAVILALPVAGWTGWELGWLPNHWERFESQAARQQVVLADGSHVELNLHSAITFTNYKNERRVTLSQGEAFFEVTHARQHPFVVKAGEGKVTVTGTRFNVWRYEDQVQVTLLEGSVLVSSNQADPGYRLDPGMQARYKAGDFQPQLKQVYANDNTLAWRNGELVLDNLPLADALPLINRYLNKPLALADSRTGAIRIGGIFNTAQIDRLVTSLPKVLPVYLTQNAQGDTVLNSISPTPKG